MLGAAACVDLVSGAAPALAPPPPAPMHPVTDDYFGTKIVDPYRWMESLDAPTVAWMKAQGAYTRAVLDSIGPRQALLEKISAFTAAFGLVSSVQAYGGRTFYLNRAPGSDSYDLMVRKADGTVGEACGCGRLESCTRRQSPWPSTITPPRPMDAWWPWVFRKEAPKTPRSSVYEVATGRQVAGPVSRAHFGAPNWADDGSLLYFNRLAETQDRAARFLNSMAVVWNLKDEPVALYGGASDHGPKVAPEQSPQVALWPGGREAAAIINNGVQNELQIWLAPGGARLG